jgi:chromosome segregation ATPase
MEAVHEQSVDSLEHLEERITRAVQVITTLRTENSQMQQKLKVLQEDLKASNAAAAEFEARSTQFDKERGDLAQSVKHLSEELDELRGERKQVRTRIEKLLSQLDLLSAS